MGRRIAWSINLCRRTGVQRLGILGREPSANDLNRHFPSPSGARWELVRTIDPGDATTHSYSLATYQGVLLVFEAGDDRISAVPHYVSAAEPEDDPTDETR